ncbi:MAG: type II toxin-antitoxin system RelE/ParE family toxin [Parvibaculaceae bacterium]|nr:type II toxin-antitoxin system RelE/ParE family toxin [Parvibaculaceae bacterium]
MTFDESFDLKEVVFINQRAEQDYRAMPPEVKESADGALTEIQNERPLSKKLFNALKGSLSGVSEIRLPYDSDTYRVYVMVFKAVVYVLDAGMKKSKSGAAIPPNQTERLIERRKRAVKGYENNKTEFERGAERRRRRHDYLVKIGKLP